MIFELVSVLQQQIHIDEHFNNNNNNYNTFSILLPPFNAIIQRNQFALMCMNNYDITVLISPLDFFFTVNGFILQLPLLSLRGTTAKENNNNMK